MFTKIKSIEGKTYLLRVLPDGDGLLEDGGRLSDWGYERGVRLDGRRGRSRGRGRRGRGRRGRGSGRALAVVVLMVLMVVMVGRRMLLRKRAGE